MAEQFPEVEQSVRVLPWFDDIVFEQGESAAKVSDVLVVDSTFFSLFDFKLLRGRPDQALVAPFSVVLSESTARRLFGDRDPMDQVVTGLNGQPFRLQE